MKINNDNVRRLNADISHCCNQSSRKYPSSLRFSAGNGARKMGQDTVPTFQGSPESTEEQQLMNPATERGMAERKKLQGRLRAHVV